MDEGRLALFLAKVKGDIEREGWSAVGVVDPLMPFTYTIGLRDTLDHPELIVYGLGSNQAHGILDSAIQAIKDNGAFVPGENRDDVIQSPDEEPMWVKIHEVPEPGRPLNMARQYHGRDEAAIQVLWPDTKGLFPGEEGYNDRDFPQKVCDGQED